MFRSPAVAVLVLAACGRAVPPDEEPSNEPARFALRGRWAGLSTAAPVTWSLEPGDGPLAREDMRRALEAALDEWQATGLVAFRASAKGDAQLVFGWRLGQHGPACLPFGVDTAIAHTGPVGPGTFVHFDLEREWNGTGERANDLRSTALHEIGHALGLDHTADEHAVMYAQPGPERRHLGRSDRLGLRTLYAAPDDATLERGSLRVFREDAPAPVAVLRGVAPADSTAWTLFDLDRDGRDDVVLWRTSTPGDLWAFHLDAEGRPTRTTGPVFGLAGTGADLRFGTDEDGERVIVLAFGERRSAVVLDPSGRPLRSHDDPPDDEDLEPFPRVEGHLSGPSAREHVRR